MANHRIYLREDINPEYWQIYKDHNKLMDKWEQYNSEILNFRIPRLLMFGTKKKLIRIGKEVLKLHGEFIEWNKRACGFAFAPRYNFDADQNKELVFIHFTSNLRFLINTLEDSMVLIATNYNKLFSNLENQINFLLAISAFLIAFIGLLISTYGLFVQLNIIH